MRIVRLDRFPLAIPLAHPMRMAGRTIASTRTVLVRLVTEAREVGWGEANVATALTGETDDSIAAALDLSGRTVENYRTGICSKLHLTGPNALLRFALRERETLLNPAK